MITKLRLVNYRTHRDTTIDLEPLTVFIGPVASGKSNVFNGLGQLAALVRREPADAFGPEGPLSFESVRYRGADADAPIEFLVEYSAGTWRGSCRYELGLRHRAGGDYDVVRERFFEPKTGRSLPYLDRDSDGQLLRWGSPASPIEPRDPPVIHTVWRSLRPGRGPVTSTDQWAVPMPPDESFATLGWGADHLAGHRLTRLDPQVLAADSVDSDLVDLEPNGRGLAAVLSWIKSALREEHAKLIRTIRRFEPRVEEVVIAPVLGDKLTWGLRFDDGQEFWAPELSDGTLLAVGLAAMAVIAPPGSRVCIEEPETGVHPRLLRDILDIFVELAYPTDGADPLQVLLSTHSPYLLDFFKDMPECVRVFDLVDGESQVRTVHQALEERRTPLDEFGDLALGEAWHAGLIGGVERCP